MTPRQHIDWLVDNSTWFQQLATSQLNEEVPSCPGWILEDLINHLSFGVGLAYPVALASSPDTPDAEVFADVALPAEQPTGGNTLEVFATNMSRCIEVFSATEPKRPCWTYAGPGVAGFWFRRAAIETALHRIDVEHALTGTQRLLADDRAADAISEAVEFALPMAQNIVARPAGRLVLSSPRLGINLQLGVGPRSALVEGNGHNLLCALWGRNHQQVYTSGDPAVAAEWLSLTERAFAGR